MGNKNISKKRVVILGAGFGGIQCALELGKNPSLDVTIIDQNAYHLIHGNLYELATSSEDFTDLLELKQSIAVPLKEIFENSPVKILQGTAVKVDAASKQIELEHGKQPYDFLVMSLGSVSNFYGIPGAEKYSLPLKSLADVLQIRNQIEFLIETERLTGSQRQLRIVIAGGGIAGIEVAAEMQSMLDFVAWKNSFPREKIETLIVEGGPDILLGFPPALVKQARKRLQDLNVKIATSSFISGVEEGSLSFKDGQPLSFDCLIWTAGVKATRLPIHPEFPIEKGDRIATDSCFRSAAPEVLVIGDQCCHLDKFGKPVPGTASQAIDHGEYAAYAISQLAKNQQPKPYICKSFPFIIPLGTNWALSKLGPVVLTGYFGYLLRQLVWLNYYTSILGIVKGFRLFLETRRAFARVK